MLSHVKLVLVIMNSILMAFVFHQAYVSVMIQHFQILDLKLIAVTLQAGVIYQATLHLLIIDAVDATIRTIAKYTCGQTSTLVLKVVQRVETESLLKNTKCVFLLTRDKNHTHHISSIIKNLITQTVTHSITMQANHIFNA